jgi:hypothetical protein
VRHHQRADQQAAERRVMAVLQDQQEQGHPGALVREPGQRGGGRVAGEHGHDRYPYPLSGQ